jgi:hypothetical protein
MTLGGFVLGVPPRASIHVAPEGAGAGGGRAGSGVPLLWGPNPIPLHPLTRLRRGVGGSVYFKIMRRIYLGEFALSLVS